MKLKLELSREQIETRVRDSLRNDGYSVASVELVRDPYKGGITAVATFYDATAALDPEEDPYEVARHDDLDDDDLDEDETIHVPVEVRYVEPEAPDAAR